LLLFFLDLFFSVVLLFVSFRRLLWVATQDSDGLSSSTEFLLFVLFRRHRFFNLIDGFLIITIFQHALVSGLIKSAAFSRRHATTHSSFVRSGR